MFIYSFGNPLPICLNLEIWTKCALCTQNWGALSVIELTISQHHGNDDDGHLDGTNDTNDNDGKDDEDNNEVVYAKVYS